MRDWDETMTTEQIEICKRLRSAGWSDSPTLKLEVEKILADQSEMARNLREIDKQNFAREIYLSIIGNQKVLADDAPNTVELSYTLAKAFLERKATC